MVMGLAGKTADELKGKGFSVVETGNYGGSILPTTTVYYGPEAGAQETAKRIADELGGAAEPDTGAAGGTGTGVTVIVTGQ
ncbi:hypothetical protein GCM10023318_16700 [Nocardia callitridis]|uniref:LytR/CpsA/Psr regulator C-terminal domain-containing protein n=2 Tax=Nocardia callitridis TaxID=648753 RepID=A0ABP9K0E7_9NOCA